VDAWLRALGNPASYGGVFNLGSGRRLSINQLADQVLTAFDRTRTDGTVVYAPGRPGEQRHVEADITRVRAVLGWEPRVSFNAGLAATVRWAAMTNGGNRPAGS
jgi:UDP-glucose 4-epimerase